MNKGKVLLDASDLAPWKQLHEKLQAYVPLAGLFRGWIPEGFEQSEHRILYVGKATSGSYDDENPEEQYFNGKGAFWSFARQINRELGYSTEELHCIAWSNVSKVSKRQIKADSSLVVGFEDMASETLEREIMLTKPQVVVFVSAHFSNAVIAKIGQTTRDEDWFKSELESQDEEVHDIWWRHRSDGVAVLSMRHPMRATMTHRHYAARKIAHLASSR